MAKVSVISSSIIRPTGNITQSGRPKIHLTPLDLNFLNVPYPQRGLLFPKPDPETHFISRLKTSLSSALEIYFPLVGRLVKVNNHEDNTVSFYVDCNDGLGAKFVHAIAESVSVSDLLQTHGSVPDLFKLFFPVNGVKGIQGISEPLLAVQVTEIKDGIFISFGYNHLVADGPSIWNFFHDWSNISLNGQPENLQPLVLRGWILDEIDYPIRIPVSEIQTEIPLPSRDLSLVPITEDRVFHFTKKNVSDLKAKANSEIGASNLTISSLQAVLAHLWRSMIKHNGLHREQECHCKVAADMRHRLNPPLEKMCFGNVAYRGIATVSVGELQDHGLGWAALQIRKMVACLTDEAYKTRAHNLIRNIKMTTVGVGSGMIIGDFVTVTSSHWFQVYDNDFGWGKPIAARSELSDGISGKLVLFRGIEEGSFDVQATLWSHLLVKLLADIEFMEYVGNA